MSNYIYILTLLGLNLIQCLASGKLQMGCDNPLCICAVATKEFGALEFRIVCEGNGTQDVILDETIFKNEPKPDFTRRMYTRMTNFASLTVDNAFLTKWLAYTSCSFDIWSCQRTNFPANTPPISASEAPYHQFAGIGVINSDIIAFPPNIFRGKKEAGLKLVQSNVSRLNIADFGSNAVNYFIANNSLIEMLEGSIDNPIELVLTPKNGNININIQNTTIGILKKGSLTFSNHSKLMRAKVVLNKATMGLVEEGSIHIGQYINLIVKQSYFGSVPPNSILISEKGRMAMEQNVLRLQRASLGDIICNDDIKITNNIILPEDLNRCLQSELNGSNPCDEFDSNSSFIDSSCVDNHIWSTVRTTTILPTTVLDTTSTATTSTTELQITTTTSTTEPPITTTTPMETTSSNLTEETTIGVKGNIAPTVPSAELLYQYRVPMGLFYLVIALCLALLVIVMVLTAMVVWGRFTKKNSSTTKLRSECMYEEPSAVYFAPRVPSPAACFRNQQDRVSFSGNIYNEVLNQGNDIPMYEPMNQGNDEPMYEDMNDVGTMVFTK